ncbi:MAG: amidase [Candidatus Obscuribacterales bacterium]|nr:amidase [Candidatus Obscuribacterales bacterium]
MASVEHKDSAFIKRRVIEPTKEGQLSRLTFAVKDLIDTAGDVTTCGNPDWAATHAPAKDNASCVQKLLDSGAQCVGKTVTDELAFSLIGENYFYGTPLNPKSPKRVPGGSSSGSASAVACNLVDFALGTDTGGSVRVPASNCGLFGLRPSHGIISMDGIMPFAPSLDTVGIFARSMNVLKNVASILLQLEDQEVQLPSKIYVLEEAFDLANDDVQETAMSALTNLCEQLETSFETLSIRSIDAETVNKGLINWLSTYNTIQRAEIWDSLGNWIESTSPKLGPATKINFEHCKDLNRKKLPDCHNKRELYAKNINGILSDNALICIPTTPSPAPLKGTIGTDRDTDTYYPRALSLTSIAGLCRLPQLTVPILEVDDAPVGLSLIAAHSNDSLLLNLPLWG